MPSEPAILIVSIASEDLDLSRAFAESGFIVEVSSGAPASASTVRPHHMLVLVHDSAVHDVVAFCEALRSQSVVPIIVVTASDDEERVVAALEAGADDVVARTVRTRELVARVRAAIRRRPKPPPEAEQAIQVGDVRLDPEGYEVTLAGEPLYLTPVEFNLLRVLMANAGHTVPRRVLIERVWGWDTTETKTLDTHIRRIRRKLDQDPQKPSRITTVRKVGYRYNRPPSTRPS